MAENEDNLAPLITQCPNCEARFRVTESQLQVAHGRVRCGSCLSVFDATAQLLMDGELLGATLDSDVDAFLDELAFDDEVQADAGADINTEVEPVSATNEPTVPAGTAAPAGSYTGGGTAGIGNASGKKGGEQSDKLQDQQEIGKPGEGSDEQQEHQFPAELLALEAALLDEMKEPGQVRVQTDVSSGGSAAKAGNADTDKAVDDDTDWVGELDEAAWSDSDVAVPEIQVLAHDAAQSGNPAGQDLEAQDLEAQDLEAIEEPPIAVEEPAAASANAEGARSGGSEVRRGFEDLRIPEPSVFEEAELPPRRSWTTLALIGIAVVALPAQVLWFQFDTWAKDERFRPMYSSICSVMGCDLPVMRDLTKLERREFHMRHHPESDNAYIFDLLIVNVADYPQPYPVIELIASTERGSLVAGRRFKPEEYLHGEVRPTDLLPPRTPVHISLEIEHPGHPNLEFQTRFR